MQFLGHLFLRRLLPAKILYWIVETLTNARAGATTPQEHFVESACELLTTVGYTLETTQTGKSIMEETCARLTRLRNSACSEDGSRVFSKRLQFRIDDLLELRQHRWYKKSYREKARTLEEVRKESSGGFLGQVFATTKAGAQPAYMVSEPAPEPDADFSPSKSAEPAETIKDDEVNQVFSGLTFDRAYVERCLLEFSTLPVAKRDASTLCHRWSLSSPSIAEVAQGAWWLLEAQDNRDAAVEIVCTLLACRHLNWRQLSSSAPQPNCRSTCAVAAVMVRAILQRCFEPFAFRVLPSDPEEAWGLLTRVLRLLREAGDAEAQQRGLEEFWEVLCALRGVPIESSEQDLISHLVEEDIISSGVARAFVSHVA
jgi:hypothetical protein